MGHDVTVLTCSGRESNTYQFVEQDFSFKIQNVENRTYSFLEKVYQWLHGSNATVVESISTGKNLSVLGRIVQDIMERQHDCRMPHVHDFWWYYALKEINGGYWDLVVSTYAPPVTHLIGRTLKKRGLAGCWIADFRDLWVDHHIAPGIFPFNLMERFIEKSCVKNADIVTTVSSPLACRLKIKYPSARVEIVHNGVDFEEMSRLPPFNVFGEPKVRLVYTGSIYLNRQDPAPLFEAINGISKNTKTIGLLDNLEIVFVGVNSIELDQLVSKYNVGEWVTLLRRVPRIDALCMQRDASVLLFLEHEDPNMDGILTGKLFEYLNSGTEIWGIGITDRMESGRLILASKTGRLFGTDSHAIRFALIDLLESGQKKQIAPQSEIIEQFDRKLLAKKMLALAEDQLSKQGRKEKRVVD